MYSLRVLVFALWFGMVMLDDMESLESLKGKPDIDLNSRVAMAPKSNKVAESPKSTKDIANEEVNVPKVNKNPAKSDIQKPASKLTEKPTTPAGETAKEGHVLNGVDNRFETPLPKELLKKVDTTVNQGMAFTKTNNVKNLPTNPESSENTEHEKTQAPLSVILSKDEKLAMINAIGAAEYNKIDALNMEDIPEITQELSFKLQLVNTKMMLKSALASYHTPIKIQKANHQPVVNGKQNYPSTAQVVQSQPESQPFKLQTKQSNPTPISVPDVSAGWKDPHAQTVSLIHPLPNSKLLSVTDLSVARKGGLLSGVIDFNVDPLTVQPRPFLESRMKTVAPINPPVLITKPKATAQVLPIVKSANPLPQPAAIQNKQKTSKLSNNDLKTLANLPDMELLRTLAILEEYDIPLSTYLSLLNRNQNQKNAQPKTSKKPVTAADLRAAQSSFANYEDLINAFYPVPTFVLSGARTSRKRAALESLRAKLIVKKSLVPSE